MEIAIVALQTLCFAGLALGTALSLYQLMQRDKVTDHFRFAVANDSNRFPPPRAQPPPVERSPP